MDDDFFRAEVTAAKNHRWIGSVRFATPPSFTVWTTVAVLAGLVIGTTICNATYARREHVEGILLPATGLIKLAARSEGSVDAVTAAEGAHVRAGDIILSLSTNRVSKALGDTSAVISSEINSQRARLAEDIATTEKLGNQQAEEYRTQIQSLARQLAEIDAQADIETRQVSSLATMLGKMEPLVAKGYISGLQIQQQRDAKLSAESQLSALYRQRLELRQQRDDAQSRAAQLPLATLGKINELRRQASQLGQSLASNEADRTSLLRAPVDGVVSTMLVKPGQMVALGQALATVVPDGAPLQAHLMVPSSAIGFVHEGLDVSLRYQAFPYQKFGLQKGVVASVSHSALTADQVSELAGKRMDDAFYRVVVKLSTQHVMAYGKPERLMSGMSTEADIYVDRRRLAEWLFEPLLGMRRQWGASNGGH